VIRCVSLFHHREGLVPLKVSMADNYRFGVDIVFNRNRQSLIFTLTLLAAGASYAGTELLQPIGPSVFILDPSYPLSSTYNGAAGYVTGAPGWVVPQWNIPQSLIAASGSSSGWSIANQYARVQYYPQIDGGQNVYELAQAQDNVSRPCGTERDLFLQATYGGIPGTSIGYTKSDPLSQLGSLHVGVGLSVPWDQNNFRCPLNYGQFVHSLILKSTTGQQIFYQINLGRSQDPGQLTNVQWCPDYEIGSNAGTQDYCLDDDVRNFGGIWVAPYTNVLNSIDVLPRILQILKAGHSKPNGIALDQDPSHWTTDQVYVGDIVQGDYVSTTRWYGLSLKNFPGGTFCSGTNNVQWVCFQGQPDGDRWVDVGGGCYHRNSNLPCL